MPKMWLDEIYCDNIIIYTSISAQTAGQRELGKKNSRGQEDGHYANNKIMS